MPSKNKPGCKCCGCVASGTTVCICGCKTAYSQTVHVGDTQGTHALTWDAVHGYWTGSYTMTVETFSWAYQSVTCSGTPWTIPVCTSEGNNSYTISIQLRYDCTAGQWTLSYGTPNVSCEQCNGTGTESFGKPANDSRGFSSGYGVYTRSDSIAIDCTNTTLLSFTIASNYPDAVAYPFPDGGGSVSVTFG